MLRLPPVDYRRARSVREAAAILANEGSEAAVVAGGTDLWPNMKRGQHTPRIVVGLLGAAELAGIHGDGAGLQVGATTRLSALLRHPWVRERYPAFARALAAISTPALRNMGTLGGNLCLDTRCNYYDQSEEWRRAIGYCMKRSGEICWVATGSPRCWAQSASDCAPVLCALGARVRLVSAEGEREVPLAAFYRDDGIAWLAKRHDELVSSIRLPAAAAAEHCRATFWKLRRRGAIDFAALSVAAAVWLEPDGCVRQASIYLGAVGSAPLAAVQAQDALAGARLEEEVIDEAARLARRVATPLDNTDFTPAWRGRMAEQYTRAALREIAGLPPERVAPKHGLTDR